MERYFVGLDVSKDETAICVRDNDGRSVLATKKPTDPDAIAGALSASGLPIITVVMETGRMANWLYHELARRGVPIVCVDARQADAVLSQMHNKTDANDAAILADLARTGFYRKVIVTSQTAQERRALLRAREVAIKTRMNVENMIRGLLANFGVVFPRHLRTFEQRILDASTRAPMLSDIIMPLLRIRTEALRQVAQLFKAMLRHTREDDTCRRLMSIPGAGAVSAVTFVATIDDPARFRRSRSVGAYVGLTSRRFQSGEMDYGGRISRRGDQMLRTVLYEAASGQGLKDWAMELKKRTSHKKAVVALARKLTVIMHAIWRDGTTFELKEA
ncbi:IS110 family transposase [Sphingobium tyrosinilyticum]|uniref:IS110 family transposase n=1 Tax=Sphingobium tyrosinilyticum TaxID=2715436 RepID=A0ABV9EZI8_9SPHN